MALLEHTFKIFNATVKRVEIQQNGKIIKIIAESEEKDIEFKKINIIKEQDLDEMFPVVEIEKIDLRKDKFMKYLPEDEDERRVYENILKAKKIGMKNFRIPVVDPSFGDDGLTIVYEKDREPAVGKCAECWEQIFENFMPSKNSGMCRQIDYDVLLGVIIKYFVDEQIYDVRKAWNVVCKNSEEIGHYKDCRELINYLEKTGSRLIYKWYDRGNTCKIIKSDDGLGYFLAGASYNLISNFCPISRCDKFSYKKERFPNAVGLMRLDE